LATVVAKRGNRHSSVKRDKKNPTIFNLTYAVKILYMVRKKLCWFSYAIKCFWWKEFMSKTAA